MQLLEQVKPQILVGVCHDCRLKHRIEVIPGRYSAAFDYWMTKHPGHRVEFRRPRHKRHSPNLDPFGFNRSIEDYHHNADIKEAFASSAAFTITLASLASDTNLVAGRESTAIDNGTNLYPDYLVGGKIRTGNSPTAARKIEVWAYGEINDTPTYPAGVTGSDANLTLNSLDIKAAALALLAVMGTDATSDRDYWMRPTSIATAFGIMPRKFGLYVVHNTAANLNSTGGNHVLNYKGVYFTSI